MPMHCSAIGCKSTININKEKAADIKLGTITEITFHVFPSIPDRRAKWIEIMKLQKKVLGPGSRLCSLHFEEKFIDRTSVACVRLRENAIPHISEDILDKTKHEANIINATNKLPLQSLENIQQVDKHTQFTYPMSAKETSFSLLQETKSIDDEENTNISPDIICNSPKSTRKKILCSDIDMLRKRVEVLQMSRPAHIFR
ncbi:PREDICTED: THAP domain-containing protein 2-like [Vollenhovia emeryi]|uniref:THAP domain-containing protein 2-like n=1 Tax=Vollenhovia emeryi TaxID=411798 RepID=UPI0005F39462|nr:PREDICTED: THAP domain-containing protein 2-like [Vollenhovia emeryi]